MVAQRFQIKEPLMLMPLLVLKHTDELHDIITAHPNRFVRAGTGLFFLLLATLLLLSWFIKFPTTVQCAFFMTSSNAPKPVVSRVSSRLARILVRERQVVEAGQPLAYIESPADYNEVLRLSTHLDSLYRRLADARSPAMLASAPYIPTHLGELQVKYEVFAQASRQLRSMGTRGFYAQKEHLLRAELGTLQRQEKNLGAQKKLYRDDWRLARQELKAQQGLARQGVIAAADFRREESREIAKQFPVKQAEAAHLSNEAAQRAKQQELLDLHKLLDDQYDAYVQGLNTLRSAIDDWKSRYVLTAPGPGQVHFSGMLEANQAVRPNEEVFFISSSAVQYYGEMLVPQQNLGKVRVGQQVLIKLDGYPFSEFGLVEGRVASLSEMPTAKNNFLAKVNLSHGLVTTYGKKIVYRNRISARADIITEDTRLLQRILYQLRLSFNSLQ